MKYLRAALDILPMSQDLATIRSNLDLEQSVNELKREPIDESTLRKFLQHNEFNSWLQELGTDDTTQVTAAEVSYTTILDMVYDVRCNLLSRRI